MIKREPLTRYQEERWSETTFVMLDRVLSGKSSSHWGLRWSTPVAKTGSLKAGVRHSGSIEAANLRARIRKMSSVPR